MPDKRYTHIARFMLCSNHFIGLNTLRPRPNGYRFAYDVFKYIWMKMYEFWLTFHWSLLLSIQLSMLKHRFRQWFGADQATDHYEPMMVILLTHVCITRSQSFILPKIINDTDPSVTDKVYRHDENPRLCYSLSDNKLLHMATLMTHK